MCFAHIEKLQEGDHNGKKSLIRWSIEKIYSVQSSQLFAGSSGDSIHTAIVVSDLITKKRLLFPLIKKIYVQLLQRYKFIG